MLQIKNVNLNVGNTALLSNINLTLEQGKIYGVLGPNGAGKTTLFKSMLGLTAFSGEILSDALHFDWFAVLSGIQKQNLHQLDYLRVFKEEALSIESYCQRRYRHLFCGCLIYRIWPIGGDTQWSWQVDRRYFPVPQAGNRVWN